MYFYEKENTFRWVLEPSLKKWSKVHSIPEVEALWGRILFCHLMDNTGKASVARLCAMTCTVEMSVKPVLKYTGVIKG
ncbi:hypothetical protein DC345_12140 [Paenibacillus taichungensis]|uniref:Uncharacterized protein n=1 Tax=Paenibacillus taichungensis TaxID=484184 RepID=A0A329QV36_9BACL|nr:hypothetical protein DC345_12140 [Paenibacillus taichungensis]